MEHAVTSPRHVDATAGVRGMACRCGGATGSPVPVRPPLLENPRAGARRRRHNCPSSARGGRHSPGTSGIPAETAGSDRQVSGMARPGSAAFDRTDAMHSSSQEEGPCSTTGSSLPLPPEPSGPRRPPTQEGQTLQVPELMRRVTEQSHVDEGEARRAVTAVLRTTREAVNPGRQPQEDRVQARDAEPHDRVPDAGTPASGVRCAGSAAWPARGHIRISADRRGGPGPGVMDARGAPTLQGRCVARWQGRDGLDDSLTVPAPAVLP